MRIMKINNKTIEVILNLWQNHVPTTTIAAALDIQYATIATYIRGFKALYDQYSAEQVVATTLIFNDKYSEFKHLPQSTYQDTIAHHTGQEENI